MTPKEFIKTVYLGDRACKAIVIDGWKRECKIQVDCISRVRSNQWNYYIDEDLIDGYLVFEGVTNISFEPPGLIINDWITPLSIDVFHEQEELYKICFSMGAGNDSGHVTEVVVTIIANSMSLDDICGNRIRD